MIDLYVKLCAKMCDKKGGGIAETLSFLHTLTHLYSRCREKFKQSFSNGKYCVSYESVRMGFFVL